MKKKHAEEISAKIDCKAGNLLDFVYFKRNYRLFTIDLSKKNKLKDPQQVIFIGKLQDQNKGATMYFIVDKLKETSFEFLQKSVNIL